MMSVLGQKRDPAKATKKRDSYVLPDEKLQQREAVYLIYQRMARRGRHCRGEEHCQIASASACDHAKRDITSVQKCSIDFIKVTCGINAL